MNIPLEIKQFSANVSGSLNKRVREISDKDFHPKMKEVAGKKNYLQLRVRL